MWTKHLIAATLVTTICLVGVFAGLSNLHVKYAFWDGYYNIPLTLADVKGTHFVPAGHDTELNVDLYSYPADPRFFLLFTSDGQIAGIRTGYIKSDVSNRAKSKNLTLLYDWDSQPLYSSGTYWNTSIWYTTVLLVHPDTLKSTNKTGPKLTVGANIYLPLEGNWTELPQDQCRAESMGFTKQACFVGMGMHYFYQMKNTARCEDLTGVFLLYESGVLVGLGITPFGSFTSKDRTWFEDPPASVVKDIVPNRPACLTDWVSNFGTTSIHIFFKKFPRMTFCVWPWQKGDQCPK